MSNTGKIEKEQNLDHLVTALRYAYYGVTVILNKTHYVILRCRKQLCLATKDGMEKQSRLDELERQTTVEQMERNKHEGT